MKLGLKGVGKNLQDHLSVGVEYARKGMGPFPPRMRIDNIAREMAQAYFLGTGAATNSPGGVMGFIKSSQAKTMPDIQILFRMAPVGLKPYWPFIQQPWPTVLVRARCCCGRPARGAVQLALDRPRAKMRIQQNFLGTDADVKLIREGVRMVRDICRQKPVQEFATGELAPGSGAESDADIEDGHVART